MVVVVMGCEGRNGRRRTKREERGGAHGGAAGGLWERNRETGEEEVLWVYDLLILLILR